ncbi:MAG: ribonucleotide-diphosphate reductase [Ignavibacteriae bacterium]|nr:ribonucleotide-diphosphate reductase [Ignavibacteriota bacterium]
MNEIYKTTSETGLDKESFPFKLYQKAKKFGIWNPEEIDFTKDKTDWINLNEKEKDVILRLTAMFQAGEESVTEHILPLISVIAKRKELEEEMYLTTFLFEEAKHTEFFRKFLDDVTESKFDLTKYHTENYRTLFYEELPNAMNNLLTDDSDEALVIASTTYNMIVEGILAETGYHAYFTMLKRNGIMEGMQNGITLLKRDESRHIAYGVYLLAKSIKNDPSLFEKIEERMNSLFLIAMGIISEIFESYDEMPFGLKMEDFTDFALDQFNKRFEKLERAKSGIIDMTED